jgi:hypothetical protein
MASAYFQYVRPYQKEQGALLSNQASRRVILDEFEEEPGLVFVMEHGLENRPVPLTELFEPDWLARFSRSELRSDRPEGSRFDRIGSDAVPSPERVSASPTCGAVQTGVTGYPLRRRRKGGDDFLILLGRAGTIGRLELLFSLGGVT